MTYTIHSPHFLNPTTLFHKLDPFLLTLVGLPFLFLLFIHCNWFFDSDGATDSFMYVGQFLHYMEHLPILEIDYKSSRLPWILPGAWSYHLFGPVWGSYVLHLSFLILALTSLYLTLKLIFDAKTAFLSTVIVACYPHFYQYGWSNYHNHAAIAYYFVTMLCLTLANKSGMADVAGRIWLFFAGISYTCAVHTTLFALLVAPLVVTHFVLLNHLGTRRNLLKVASEFVAGGVFVTLLLGLINYVTGGPFLFFMAQVNYTLWFSQDHNDLSFYSPLSSWIGHGYHLALPLTMLFVILFLTFFRPVTTLSKEKRMVIGNFFIQFAFILGIFYYFGEIRQHPTLNQGFLFYLFIAPMIFALAGIFSLLTAVTLPLLNTSLFLLGTLFINFAPWMLGTEAVQNSVSTWLKWPLGNLASSAPILLPILLSMMGFASLRLLSKWKFAIFVTFTCFSLSHLLMIPAAYLTRKECCFSTDTFQATMEFDRFVTPLDPTLASIKYWYNPNESLGETHRCNMPINLGRVFHSVVSTRRWCINMVNGCIPNPEELRNEFLGRHQKIGILSNVTNKDKYVTDMQTRFTNLGKVLIPMGEKTIESGRLQFVVSIFEVAFSPHVNTLQRAQQLHQMGDLAQAENLYRQVLQAEPNNPQALHYLGVLAAQVKNYDAAMPLMKQAITLNPTVPLFYSNFAGALMQQGRLTEAVLCYQRALTLNPQDEITKQQLAAVLKKQSQWTGEEKLRELVDETNPCFEK